VLEVHVDVRRLVAFAADEALEQHVAARGVHRGDPQAEADRAVGRRAATLAEDALPARERHHRMHGEEVAGVVEVADDGELVLEERAHLRRHTARRGRPALRGALLHQRTQVVNGHDARRRHLAWIAIAEHGHREARAARRHVRSAGDGRGAHCLGHVREHGAHAVGTHQVARVVRHEPRTGPCAAVRRVHGVRALEATEILHRAAGADGREHVLEGLACAHVAARIVARHQRNARLLRKPFKLQEPQRIVRAGAAHESEGKPVVVEHRPEPPERFQEARMHGAVAIGRHDDRLHAGQREGCKRPVRAGHARAALAGLTAAERLHAGIEEIVEPQVARGGIARGFARLDAGLDGVRIGIDVERPARAALAKREQPAEPCVAIHGFGQEDQFQVRGLAVEAQREHAARTNHQLHAVLLGSHVRTDHAGHRVAVRDGHGRHAQLRRARNDFLGVARTLEEGEVAHGGELGE
jgi:hypothetical protein